jgi:hypothetical protein
VTPPARKSLGAESRPFRPLEEEVVVEATRWICRFGGRRGGWTGTPRRQPG